MRVSQPPAKPTLLWDRDCHFCHRWIERWHEITGDAVDYQTSQEAGARFPEITPEQFQQAVVLVEKDGCVYKGAAAVFYSLGQCRRGKWLRWSYDHVPGFAPVTEFFYRFIARRRQLASRITRLLWGSDVRRPTYQHSRDWFLRGLGLAYLCAFVSIWVQVDGLMGERGIMPAREILNLISRSGGPQTPTLCWLSSSDTMLHLLCAAGTGASLLLLIGIVPLGALIVCFVCYLSLIPAGEFLFSYQWDILLLEAGFLAFFVAPLRWALTSYRATHASRIGLFLLKFLLFKLMFMSGVVKLTSGDNCWFDLTALDYHYWTQPLPTVFAWFADKNPEWLKKLCVAATLLVEIIVPFFIWAPRRLRHIAALLLIALQVGIAITGNYNFFNLITIVLCLLLIDDSIFETRTVRPAKSISPIATASAAIVLLVTLPVNAWHLYNAIRPEAEWPKAIAALYRATQPIYLTNGYGLFRVMTKERPEIIFEGSTDGGEWRAYEFKYKPGDLRRAPRWNAPHQPRLDWSMWFAALGSRRDRAVVERLVFRLLRNEPTVLHLLGRNPFAAAPPRYIRATVYNYRFTTSAERKATGDWWKREWRGEYLPSVSLDDFSAR